MVNPGKKLKKFLFILGMTGAVYGGIRYILPLVVPFLFAYGTAVWLRPSIRSVQKHLVWTFAGKKHHPSAGLIGAVEIGSFLIILVWILYFGGSRLVRQLSGFSEEIPQWISRLDMILTEFFRNMERVMGFQEEFLVSAVREILGDISDKVRRVSMPTVMNHSIRVIKGMTKGIIFFVIYLISVILFLQEIEEIRERKSQSLFHREFTMVGRRLLETGSAWLRVECVLIGLTSVICICGLYWIGNEYALIIGLGIGFLDALPLFGAGVILVPWGVVYFLQKQWMEGCLLVGIYLVCYFLRQVLEAKMMGNKVGLAPSEALISMYVGLQLFGFWGIFLGPVGFLILEDLIEFYWKEDP